jgi:CRP-like cAMP-binding protein
MSDKEKLRKVKDRASKAFSDGKLKEALKLYQQAVEEDPSELACQIKVGDIHRRLGQRPQAVAAYEPVARHYAEDGLLLKAIAVCKLILSVDVAHTATQEMLANLYAARATPGGRPSTADLPGLSPPPPKQRRRTTFEIDLDEESDEEMIVERTVPAPPSVKAPPVIVGAPVEGSPPSVIVGTKVTDGAAPEVSRLAPTAVGGVWPVSGAVGIAAKAPERPAAEPPAPPKPYVPQGIASAWPGASVAPASPPAVPPLAPMIAADEARGLETALTVETASTRAPAARGAPGAQPANVIVADAGGSLEEVFEHIGDTTPPGGLAPHSPPGMPDSLDDTSHSPIELNRVSRPQAGTGRGDDLGQPQIPLFSDLPRNAFIEILVKMKMRELSPGDHVISEGETGNSFFVLAQGRVRISRKDQDGKDTVLAYLTDGAFFGEMALLQDGARTASVIVEEESQIFEISKEVLDDVVAQYPSVARVLRNFYTQRLLSTTMATHALFKSFGPKERRDLMELFKSRTFKKGAVLVEEAKKGEGLYLCLYGTLEVSKIKDGDPIVIAELDAGDMFGEMSLLTSRPTVATVTATSDCFVLRLSKKDFDEVIMTHPQVLELVSQISEERETENSAIFGAWTPRSEEGAALV